MGKEDGRGRVFSAADDYRGPPPIEGDVGRFKKILRGDVRKNLGKYIGHDEMWGVSDPDGQGKRVVSIPVDTIELPTFRNGRGRGGVGQGEGEPGTPLGPGEPGHQDGQAGREGGQHALEVELDEILDMIEEEVDLGEMKPSKTGNIIGGYKYKVKSVTTVPGPGFLFKKSYKNALHETSGDREKAVILARAKPHRRFRSSERVEIPTARGVVIIILDVSGSMTAEKKALMRKTVGYYMAMLHRHYPTLEVRYIVHDVNAKEVSEETAMHIRESGGTKISAGIEYCRNMIANEYVDDDWNIFALNFSDGENWGEDDDERCLNLIEGMLSKLRSYCYVELQGSNTHLKRIFDHLATRKGGKEGNGRVETIRIDQREHVLEAIRRIAGKKKKK